MQDVMIDLETLGIVPGCALLSIGAVAFDEFDVLTDDGFYAVISTASCSDAGLHEDQSTKDWWAQQSNEARKVLDEAGRLGTALPLANVLDHFERWLSQFKNPRVWGNGADFDLPLISAAARAVQRKAPWKPFNGRCYRTVKNQFADVRVQRTGTHHNALADAIYQAQHMVAICSQRGWKLA